MTYHAFKIYTAAHTSEPAIARCCQRGHRGARAAATCATNSVRTGKSVAGAVVADRIILKNILSGFGIDTPSAWRYAMGRDALVGANNVPKIMEKLIESGTRADGMAYTMAAGQRCPSCSSRKLAVSKTGARLVCEGRSSNECSGGYTLGAEATKKTAPAVKKAAAVIASTSAAESKDGISLDDLGDLGRALSDAIDGRTAQRLAESEAKVGSRMESVARTTLEALADQLRPKADHFTITITDAEPIQIEGAAHPMLQRVLKRFAIQQATNGKRLKPVLLVGPAGSGKSYLAEQVAEAMKLSFHQIGMSGGMTESALFGKLVPQGESGSFEFLSTPFIDAYEHGGVLLIDEMDAADENVLLKMNNAISNGHADIPNRHTNPVAKRHPDFYIIASANTYGSGADRVYVGRNQLDGATLDRFQMGTYEMDYDKSLEAALAPHDELRTAWQGLRAKVASAHLRRIVSTRTLIDAHDAITHGGATVAECLDQLTTGWTADEKRKAGLTPA